MKKECTEDLLIVEVSLKESSKIEELVHRNLLKDGYFLLRMCIPKHKKRMSWINFLSLEMLKTYM